jgi:hypothetical protein
MGVDDIDDLDAIVFGLFQRLESMDQCWKLEHLSSIGEGYLGYM